MREGKRRRALQDAEKGIRSGDQPPQWQQWSVTTGKQARRAEVQVSAEERDEWSSRSGTLHHLKMTRMAAAGGWRWKPLALVLASHWCWMDQLLEVEVISDDKHRGDQKDYWTEAFKKWVGMVGPRWKGRHSTWSSIISSSPTGSLFGFCC